MLLAKLLPKNFEWPNLKLFGKNKIKIAFLLLYGKIGESNYHARKKNFVETWTWKFLRVFSSTQVTQHSIFCNRYYLIIWFHTEIDPNLLSECEILSWKCQGWKFWIFFQFRLSAKWVIKLMALAICLEARKMMCGLKWILPKIKIK